MRTHAKSTHLSAIPQWLPNLRTVCALRNGCFLPALSRQRLWGSAPWKGIGTLPSPSGWPLKQMLWRSLWFLLRIWLFHRRRKVSNRTWPHSANRAALGYSRIAPRNFPKVVAGYVHHTAAPYVPRGPEIVGYVGACVFNHCGPSKWWHCPRSTKPWYSRQWGLRPGEFEEFCF